MQQSELNGVLAFKRSTAESTSRSRLGAFVTVVVNWLFFCSTEDELVSEHSLTGQWTWL